MNLCTFAPSFQNFQKEGATMTDVVVAPEID